MKFPCYRTRMVIIKSFGTTKILPWGRLPFLIKKVMRKKIVTIGDLLSETGLFLKSVKVLNAKLSPVDFL